MRLILLKKNKTLHIKKNIFLIFIFTFSCFILMTNGYTQNDKNIYQISIYPIGVCAHLNINDENVEFKDCSSKLKIDTTYVFDLDVLDSCLYNKIQTYIAINLYDLDKEIDSNVVITVDYGYIITISQNYNKINETFEIKKFTQKNGLILLKMIFEFIPEFNQYSGVYKSLRFNKP